MTAVDTPTKSKGLSSELIICGLFAAFLVVMYTRLPAFAQAGSLGEFLQSKATVVAPAKSIESKVKHQVVQSGLANPASLHNYGYTELPSTWGDSVVAVSSYAAPYINMINDGCRKVNIDARLVAALIYRESNFNNTNPVDTDVTGHPMSRSFIDNPGVGYAYGLGQLIASTAKSMGVNAHDNAQNVLGTARYLRLLLDQFGNDLYTALSAYNAGPNNPSNAAPNYANFIERNFRAFGGTVY
jgi:soluble lytic murein transglycosylase-like protein